MGGFYGNNISLKNQKFLIGRMEDFMERIVPVQQRTKLEQEFFIREINVRKSKLNNATDLSVLFALFAVLGAVDLNIVHDDPSYLVLAYVTTTSLLISNTVLVKIGLLWMLPGMETVLFLSKTDKTELDRIPPLFVLWDWVWILASSGGFLLFSTQFILISWIKYPTYSWASSIIMTPVLIAVLIFAIVSVKEVGKPTGDLQKLKRESEYLHGI